MTINTISTLPTAPARTDAPATFITRADAFLGALVTMQGELNTSIGQMNTDIAGVNTDATAAAASASAAATSESNAATSESNASDSETAAASSAAAAASSYDQFDDRYLGSKASDPAVDNDGNALLTGALYFNSTSDDMKVYTGSTWKVTGFNPDSPTFTDTVTAPSFDINSIAETTTDTAVDVFVYDTRKDSDGGAWRKRTQNTSWYNETLDTANRGSRREFPAVAVIVVETDQLTIYDGDDPSLPMWMVFNVGNNKMLRQSGGLTAGTAINGAVFVCGLTVNGGVTALDFIQDHNRTYRHSDVNTQFLGNLSQRNDDLGSIDGDFGRIVSSDCNDLAVTVLPNAPIDAATGLPVPTIAVATEGGVSVIKDDGTIVDSSSSSTVESVAFSESNDLLWGQFSAAMLFSYYPDWKTDGFLLGKILRSKTSTAGTNYPYINTVSQGKSSLATTDQIVTGDVNGLSLVTKTAEADVGTALVAYIDDTYNTGWMNGDIKLATLSDTDDTDVTGSELSSDAWAAPTGYDNTVTSISASAFSSVLNTTGNRVYVAFNTVVGKTYTFTATKTSGSDAIVYMREGSEASGTIVATGDYSDYHLITFTATTATTSILFRNDTGDYAYEDISVRIAEEDRSVNGNGLQVFGTITKEPVATGADLVAYSGWSTSNYLEQPYNSDLDFGTGDFCVMGWVKNPNENNNWFFMRGVSGSTNTFGLRELNNDLLAAVGGADISTGINLPTDWCHVAIIRNNGTFYAYLNGVNEFSTSNSNDLTESDAVLRFGIKTSALANVFGGSLALWRFSATAATAEQIAKIYEDEKFLFQDNAQATLYGTDDYVRALAYDDSSKLLHAGTLEGRSVFSGLQRVSNTTAGITAAISVSNGLVAED